jgi:hypothetical protein
MSYPTVEVVRMPGINATPRILLQEREDTPEWAMTIEEAERYLVVNQEAPHPTSGECAWCQVYDALQDLA